MIPTDETQPPPLKVGLTFNLKRDNALESEAEFDSIDTIKAIENALISHGCQVTLLEADASLPLKLQSSKLDIVFNIAEGKSGRGREAHVPSILSYYGIKFTGSDETTLCICLDKALAKRFLISHKIKTPKYQLIDSADYKLKGTMTFPVIAKPNAEGSSKGITDVSVAKSAGELRKIVSAHFESSNSTLLVEEYVKGREFTVGVIGNGKETTVFKPMEIVFRENGKSFNVYDYEIKKDCMKYVDYVCPAHISADIDKTIMDTAKKIYELLGCRDFARIDFILTPFNELNFVEINPLAGLTPGYSDFPMICEKNGIAYEQAIGLILNAALKRYNMEGL